MSDQPVRTFIQSFKDNLIIQPGSNHVGIKRNDGAKVPQPQVNFTGEADKVITDKGNHFIAVTPGPFSEAIHKLLTWAMENYPTEGAINGKKEEE